jgi:hypothetical protein
MIMPYAQKIIGDSKVEVWGDIVGKYYAATYFEPAEYPEVVITEISVDGKLLPEHFWPLLNDYFDEFDSMLLNAPREDDYDA